MGKSSCGALAKDAKGSPKSVRHLLVHSKATNVLTNRPADDTTTRIAAVHFNALGSKLGAVDSGGVLSLYTTDGGERGIGRLQNLPVHNRYASDFSFLNAGSVLATVGSSNDRRNLCIFVRSFSFTHCRNCAHKLTCGVVAGRDPTAAADARACGGVPRQRHRVGALLAARVLPLHRRREGRNRDVRSADDADG